VRDISPDRRCKTCEVRKATRVAFPELGPAAKAAHGAGLGHTTATAPRAARHGQTLRSDERVQVRAWDTAASGAAGPTEPRIRRGAGRAGGSQTPPHDAVATTRVGGSSDALEASGRAGRSPRRVSISDPSPWSGVPFNVSIRPLVGNNSKMRCKAATSVNADCRLRAPRRFFSGPLRSLRSLTRRLPALGQRRAIGYTSVGIQRLCGQSC
jgi:hypothetical protein